MYKFNKVFYIAALTLAAAIGLMGCGGAQTTGTDNKNTATTKPADNKTADNKAPDNKAADNTKTETASADKVGVPECDEYIEKVDECITSKVPEAQRAMYKSSFDTMRKSWKDAAANPQTKAALASGCKTALETAKQSYAAYGCKW